MKLQLPDNLLQQLFAHAQDELPAECCGLCGGHETIVSSIYKLKNVAVKPLIEYEAAPEDLFAAQRQMRERGEKLLAIYHSHPRQSDPKPSQIDLRRAFYPETVYFIVGFDVDKPVLGAFKIYESERRWEAVEFEVTS